MSNHEECNCEQSLRLKREVEELKAELASTTTTLVVARSDLRCPICLGLPFDDHTGMGCACGADGTTKSGGIVEAFRSVHEAWAHEKVRADAAIDRGNALNAANAALRATVAALEGQAAEDQATAGILCDVCDAAWGDDTRAGTRGYDGVVERVRYLYRALKTRDSVIADLLKTVDARGNTAPRAPMTRRPEPHRSHLIRNGLHGGNSDPNRCVCAEKETGRYADTPHVHYPEPPYACARGCGCEAYDPAVPPVPAVDEPTLEAQLAEATGRQQRALADWERFSDSANLAKLDAAYLERNRIVAAIRARDAAKAPAVDESEPVNRNPGEET